jgi:hypothetical protein
MGRRRQHRRVVAGFVTFGALAAALLPAPVPARAPAVSTTLSELTVGGGPSPKFNQVAIESNVRYVDGLLPPLATRRVLFADGRPDSKNVLYQEPGAGGTELSPAETAFRALIEPKRDDGEEKFRAPRLPALNGPAVKRSIDAELDRLSAAPGSGPILLYFTGHGSRNEQGNLDNNTFGLWNEGALSVRELAAGISRLPKDRPVVLVMVQCYGGAFGNVLFEGGDPTGALADRPLCGFFATTRERVAAGCTPEVNEAEYHDFTSYFFAALSGKDRLGRPVKATDFDNNGTVEMDEAFAYAQMTEPSIDVPVCTSDVFLRRFVPVKDDAEITDLPFSQVRGWASPAQRAVLDRLSTDLGATGEGRLKTALAEVHKRATSEGDGGGEHHTENGGNAAANAERTLRRARRRLVSRFPALRQGGGDPAKDAAYGEARKAALAYLAAHPEEINETMAALRTVGARWESAYQDELRGARWLRLMRVAKTVVLEKRLRGGSDKALLAKFERLRALEHRNPLMGGDRG